MRWLYGITDLTDMGLGRLREMDMGLGRLGELVIDRETWRAAVHGVTKSRKLQSD